MLSLPVRSSFIHCGIVLHCVRSGAGCEFDFYVWRLYGRNVRSELGQSSLHNLSVGLRFVRGRLLLHGLRRRYIRDD